MLFLLLNIMIKKGLKDKLFKSLEFYKVSRDSFFKKCTLFLNSSSGKEQEKVFCI